MTHVGVGSVEASDLAGSAPLYHVAATTEILVGATACTERAEAAGNLTERSLFSVGGTKPSRLRNDA
jgi:hypothetical protein